MPINTAHTLQPTPNTVNLHTSNTVPHIVGTSLLEGFVTDPSREEQREQREEEEREKQTQEEIEKRMKGDGDMYGQY
jgi:hypothetical protein